MTATIEIHGLSKCPFAFRTRLTAHEKGVSFDWIPFDAAPPDARAAEHNPERRSPLLWHDGFVLTESSIINQYIDEGFDGPALQPRNARQRANMRLVMHELSPLLFDGRKPLGEEQLVTVAAALRALDERLARGGPWLGGERPSLADIEFWPWLTFLGMRGLLPAPALVNASDYLARFQARDSFRAWNPYGEAS